VAAEHAEAVIVKQSRLKTLDLNRAVITQHHGNLSLSFVITGPEVMCRRIRTMRSLTTCGQVEEGTGQLVVPHAVIGFGTRRCRRI
jgi:hypothetical protein